MLGLYAENQPFSEMKNTNTVESSLRSCIISIPIIGFLFKKIHDNETHIRKYR